MSPTRSLVYKPSLINQTKCISSAMVGQIGSEISEDSRGTSEHQNNFEKVFAQKSIGPPLHPPKINNETAIISCHFLQSAINYVGLLIRSFDLYLVSFLSNCFVQLYLFSLDLVIRYGRQIVEGTNLSMRIILNSTRGFLCHLGYRGVYNGEVDQAFCYA